MGALNSHRSNCLPRAKNQTNYHNFRTTMLKRSPPWAGYRNLLADAGWKSSNLGDFRTFLGSICLIRRSLPGLRSGHRAPDPDDNTKLSGGRVCSPPLSLI